METPPPASLYNYNTRGTQRQSAACLCGQPLHLTCIIPPPPPTKNTPCGVIPLAETVGFEVIKKNSKQY